MSSTSTTTCASFTQKADEPDLERPLPERLQQVRHFEVAPDLERLAVPLPIRCP